MHVHTYTHSHTHNASTGFSNNYRVMISKIMIKKQNVTVYNAGMGTLMEPRIYIKKKVGVVTAPMT